MHRNDRTLQKHLQTEGLREWDYQASPPLNGRQRETPPLSEAPTVPAAHHRPSEDAIRTLAYSKWEAAGRPPGDGVQFWLAAEQELAARGRFS